MTFVLFACVLFLSPSPSYKGHQACLYTPVSQNPSCVKPDKLNKYDKYGENICVNKSLIVSNKYNKALNWITKFNQSHEDQSTNWYTLTSKRKKYLIIQSVGCLIKGSINNPMFNPKCNSTERFTMSRSLNHYQIAHYEMSSTVKLHAPLTFRIDRLIVDGGNLQKLPLVLAKFKTINEVGLTCLLK